MRIGSQITNPGDLRTLITLKSRSVTSETGKFQKPVWSTLASVYAKWVNVHGSEVWAADAAGASEPATVLIRYRNDIDATGAVEKDGVLYEIVSLDNIGERSEYLELKVKRWRPG